MVEGGRGKVGVGGTVGNQRKQLTQNISMRVVLLSFVLQINF